MLWRLTSRSNSLTHPSDSSCKSTKVKKTQISNKHQGIQRVVIDSYIMTITRSLSYITLPTSTYRLICYNLHCKQHAKVSILCSSVQESVIKNPQLSEAEDNTENIDPNCQLG